MTDVASRLIRPLLVSAGLLVVLTAAAAIAWHKSTHLMTHHADSPQISSNSSPAAMLAGKRVFFGHQSVGGNILHGVALLNSEVDPARRIDVVPLADAGAFDRPGIYHARIGTNRHPGTKIAAFESILIKDGVGAKVDIAALKFCYADVSRTTNVESLFAEYVAAANRIQHLHPRLTLLHVTIPLRVQSRGIRDGIRTWLFGNPENAARSRFNTLLMTHFGESNQVFDLAAAESTHPSGQRTTYIHNGECYYALIDEYSNDGGHLNDIGARACARAMLESLFRSTTTPTK